MGDRLKVTGDHALERKPGQIMLSFECHWKEDKLRFFFPWWGLLFRLRWVVSTALFVRSVAKMTDEAAAMERLKRRASDEMRSGRWDATEWQDTEGRR